MKLGIMQPYFLPYIGYWQLMNAVDTFIVYDNIQFTKKGWIHRNRFLQNGKDQMFTLPLKKDSDYLDIAERKLADNFYEENKKTLRKIEASYKKAPNFSEIFPMINEIFLFKGAENLFQFILNSITTIKMQLEINTEILVSSNIEEDNNELKSKDRVINLCNQLGADIYINAIGGVDLYERESFKSHNIELCFIKSHDIIYNQFGSVFVPYLSIIDILMFNDLTAVKKYLSDFKLI